MQVHVLTVRQHLGQTTKATRRRRERCCSGAASLPGLATCFGGLARVQDHGLEMALEIFDAAATAAAAATADCRSGKIFFDLPRARVAQNCLFGERPDLDPDHDRSTDLGICHDRRIGLGPDPDLGCPAGAGVHDLDQEKLEVDRASKIAARNSPSALDRGRVGVGDGVDGPNWDTGNHWHACRGLTVYPSPTLVKSCDKRKF